MRPVLPLILLATPVPAATMPLAECPPGGGGGADAAARPPCVLTALRLADGLVRRPGSVLFVVWSQARDDEHLTRDLNVGNDFDRLFDAPARHVFLVKMSYWIGR